MRDRLVAAGATLRKNKDELKVGHSRTGETYYYRGRPETLDYSGSLAVRNGWGLPVELEVKTFQGHLPLNALSEDQLRLLAQFAMASRLALIGLVRHEKGVIQEGWLFPYRRLSTLVREYDIASWLDLLAAVKEANQHDKRFHGKSVRPRELALFPRNHIVKASGRWQPCPWLAELCDWRL
jgi:hypothetical protein